MRYRLWLSALLLAFLLASASPATASTGTIDATGHYAWDDNDGYLNWNANGGNVTVTVTAMAPYTCSRTGRY